MRGKLLAIVVLGFLLRFLWVTQFPVGFTADEAGQGYDAYSIARTGRDGWGEFLPLFPRGFGDYKAPLYMYFTVPSVAVFGLSEWSVRLPAVIVGTAAIVATFGLAYEMFGASVGLWAALLLAISPWHIQLSRTAWEGGVGVFLFSLGLWAYVKYVKGNKKAIYWAMAIFGVCTYAYHSWRLVSALFVMGLVLMRLWKKGVDRRFWSAILIFGLILIPTISNWRVVLTRAADVGIFSKSRIDGYFAGKGVSALDSRLARVFDNKVLFVADQFWGNYLSYFSPTFWFSANRPDDSYLNFPGTPLHYPFELVFILVGGYLLLKEKRFGPLLLLWALLAPIPAALTGAMSANRAVTFLPLSILVSAYGLVAVRGFVNKRVGVKWSNIGIGTLLGVFLLFFVYTYLYKLPTHPIHNQRFGYREVFKKAIEVENQYDSIHFSRRFSVPHIFVAFYKKMDPVEFQRASLDWLRYEKSDKRYVDQLESYNLGKFEIHDLYWKADLKRKNALLVSEPDDFSTDTPSIFDMRNSRGEVIFRMVPTSKLP